MTVGARRSAFSDGGIHGSLEDVLHPIQHGLFWFTGVNPPEPFAVYSSNEFPDDRFSPTTGSSPCGRSTPDGSTHSSRPRPSPSGRSRAGTTTMTCGSCGGRRHRARRDSTCTSATVSEGHPAQPPPSI
ncbi:hypothetical protein ACFCWG_35280 [Streptomyces sp. NPDC056390]|uniref:hypothetical protein n=1 Tax=Streptomyces sp. NPDC056390 TaxID=3345806 RepID=UPI0035DDF90C